MDWRYSRRGCVIEFCLAYRRRQKSCDQPFQLGVQYLRFYLRSALDVSSIGYRVGAHELVWCDMGRLGDTAFFGNLWISRGLHGLLQLPTVTSSIENCGVSLPPTTAGDISQRPHISRPDHHPLRRGGSVNTRGVSNCKKPLEESSTRTWVAELVT